MTDERLTTHLDPDSGALVSVQVCAEALLIAPEEALIIQLPGGTSDAFMDALGEELTRIGLIDRTVIVRPEDGCELEFVKIAP